MPIIPILDAAEALSLKGYNQTIILFIEEGKVKALTTDFRLLEAVAALREVATTLEVAGKKELN